MHVVTLTSKSRFVSDAWDAYKAVLGSTLGINWSSAQSVWAPAPEGPWTSAWINFYATFAKKHNVRPLCGGPITERKLTYNIVIDNKSDMLLFLLKWS